MRVCDIIAKYISDSGINDVFFVSGGGVMFLTDGLACNDKLRKISCHHEQAASMAATAYAKYSGFGCCYVTTGCGGTNAITGVLHAWQDNTPLLVISGQVKRKEASALKDIPLRQLGVQEADIISIVKSITKYAELITYAKDIIYHLEKAEYLAKSDRPGPVWLDIPMDVSAMEVNPEELRHFYPEAEGYSKPEILQSDLEELAQDFEKAERPVIIAGQGVRLSGALDEFARFVETHNIPFVCSRLGLDVMPTEHHLNIGRIGNKGMRSANFAVQNADLVLVLGSRLSVSSTGQEYEYFAREAKVVVVDIDADEHRKNTVHIEKLIHEDIKDFLKRFALPEDMRFDRWAEHCRNWKEKYPVFLPDYKDTSKGVNLYLFMEELSRNLRADDVIVSDAGSVFYATMQGLKTTTTEQRDITSGGQAEMGFTLPGCVGVCAARGFRDVIGITGDGSLQMNLQELQTVKHNHMPIKLFIWNNDGYLSIRATQRNFFNGRFIGTDSTSGLSFPNLQKIADAYGIEFVRIAPGDDVGTKIAQVLNTPGAVVCEVMCIRDQIIQPSVGSRQLEDGRLVSSPIEDMKPFLPRDEFYSNMLVKPID